MSAMRWSPWRWFLVGYAGCPLIVVLLGAIVVAIAERSVAGLTMIVPAVLFVCFLAPLGLIVGMVCGISPDGWGPWDGRLVYMGLVAGLVVLVIAGLRLENRNRRTNPVLDGGDGTPRVPTARVVTAQRAYLFPTVAWNRLIGRLATVAWNQLTGPALLVIAGVALFCLGVAGWAAVADVLGGA